MDVSVGNSKKILRIFRSLRLSARTGDSHSSKRGSIPLGTKNRLCLPVFF